MNDYPAAEYWNGQIALKARREQREKIKKICGSCNRLKERINKDGYEYLYASCHKDLDFELPEKAELCEKFIRKKK